MESPPDRSIRFWIQYTGFLLFFQLLTQASVRKGEHCRQGAPRRTLAAFSGSTDVSQPSPCGLIIPRLGRLGGASQFSARGRNLWQGG